MGSGHTNVRVRDFALIIGHTWRCTSCRTALVDAPDTACIGYKLSEFERERIQELDDSSFQTVMNLAKETGLTVKELEAAIDHPRARLRHLGSIRNHTFATIS